MINVMRPANLNANLSITKWYCWEDSLHTKFELFTQCWLWNISHDSLCHRPTLTFESSPICFVCLTPMSLIIAITITITIITAIIILCVQYQWFNNAIQKTWSLNKTRRAQTSFYGGVSYSYMLWPFIRYIWRISALIFFPERRMTFDRFT